MTSCPYPTHQGSFDVALSQSSVAYCRDGCGLTFFLCARCQAGNKPLARFCRQCGAPILYEAAQAQLGRVRPLQEERSESYRLSAYGVSDVQALKTYKGFLFVVADRSVLIYDLHKIYEPLFQFSPPDRRIIRGVTMVASDSDDYLLVTTSRSVYRLSLLSMSPEAAPAHVAADGRYITQPVVSCGEEIYAIELDERLQSSRLVRLAGEDVFSFEGLGRSLLRLSETRFFFCTQDQVFTYDDGRVLVKKFPEQIAESDGAYSRDSDMVYLAGESGLWRLVTSKDELAAVSLPTRILGAPLLAASSDSVFVAHTQGFLVLDPFGGVRWDSAPQNIRAESDGHIPQSTTDYVLFTALGQTGGSKLRIHALDDLNDFRTIDFEYRLLCPPLLTMGRVISATGGAGEALLGCVV